MYDFMFVQNNVVTTVYDIFHLYISYHSSSSIYVDLLAPVANVIGYYTTSTINKYFLSYLIISYYYHYTRPYNIYVSSLHYMLFEHCVLLIVTASAGPSLALTMCTKDA